MKGSFVFLAFHLAVLACQPLAASAAGNQATARQPDAEGEVIEVDAKAQRVLIKHGRIQSIGMDPMTMEFLVTDGQSLARLKPGDRVRFAASWKNGEYIASDIKVVKPATAPRKPAQPQASPAK